MVNSCCDTTVTLFSIKKSKQALLLVALLYVLKIYLFIYSYGPVEEFLPWIICSSRWKHSWLVSASCCCWMSSQIPPHLTVCYNLSSSLDGCGCWMNFLFGDKSSVLGVLFRQHGLVIRYNHAEAIYWLSPVATHKCVSFCYTSLFEQRAEPVFSYLVSKQPCWVEFMRAPFGCEIWAGIVASWARSER